AGRRKGRGLRQCRHRQGRGCAEVGRRSVRHRSVRHCEEFAMTDDGHTAMSWNQGDWKLACAKVAGFTLPDRGHYRETHRRSPVQRLTNRVGLLRWDSKSQDAIVMAPIS